MTMYAQIYEGRIVGLAEEKQEFFETPVDSPNDFDWEHIFRYELTSSGELICHALPAGPMDETDAALLELAAMLAATYQRLDEQDAALVELAGLIAGGE